MIVTMKIVLKIVTADVMYLGLNEITELLALGRTKNVSEVQIIVSFTCTLHLEQISYLLVDL